MIEIQSQDYTTYDVPGEYHVRCPEKWNGWLILQNPVHNDTTGVITGVIKKPVKVTEGEGETAQEVDSFEDIEVSLLPAADASAPEGGTVNIGVHEEVGTKDVGPGDSGA